MFARKPLVGLRKLNLPDDVIDSIQNEEDLAKLDKDGSKRCTFGEEEEEEDETDEEREEEEQLNVRTHKGRFSDRELVTESERAYTSFGREKEGLTKAVMGKSRPTLGRPSDSKVYGQKNN